MFLLPAQFSHITELMDASELRQRVISHNLANVNTPGFKRLDVIFEETLAEQVRKGDLTTPAPAAQVRVEQGLPARADGNTVDVDREVSQLNRNAMLFQTYSQLLTAQFDLMRRATRG
ncbi:flagellar basal body rod protein FlgB [Planctomicrobium piriforme]|uniref:flagellar basal body rod protein FlgB n=1 Tax=Planctomicrobium piriforme TaxID=1576369 RepID=UPI0015878B59|nr:flagellar basal body rod protein FlgB [Planctomicrobium piriforme]